MGDLESYLERLRRRDPSPAVGGVLSSIDGLRFAGNEECKKTQLAEEILGLLNIGDP